MNSAARETLILKKATTGGPMLALQTSDGVEVANLSSSADSIELFNYSGHRKNASKITSIGVSTDGYAFVGSGSNIETKYKLWHEGNDGSGSGLDADTVDNLHASSFVRSDTSHYMGYYDLQSIPKNKTQTVSFGWDDY